MDKCLFFTFKIYWALDLQTLNRAADSNISNISNIFKNLFGIFWVKFLLCFFKKGICYEQSLESESFALFQYSAVKYQNHQLMVTHFYSFALKLIDHQGGHLIVDTPQLRYLKTSIIRQQWQLKAASKV